MGLIKSLFSVQGASYKTATPWELCSVCVELAINAGKRQPRVCRGVYGSPFEKIMESLRKIPFRSIKIRGELILW